MSGKNARKTALLLILLFLLGGFLHIVLYGKDWTDSICQIYYGVLLLIWIFSIQSRIVDKKVRRLLVGSALLLEMLVLQQVFSYSLLADEYVVVKRYNWYFQYLPYLFSGCLLVLLSLEMGHGENEKKDKRKPALPILCFLMAALVLTNNLHRLVFRFPGGLYSDDEKYTHGFFYYVLCTAIAAMLLTSLGIMLRKCRVLASKKLFWMPILMLTFGDLCLILFWFGIPSYQGIKAWNIPECYAFCVVGFEETCIALGLIPSNLGYDRLQRLTAKAVWIEDASGKTVIRSQNAASMQKEGKDVKKSTQPISGGSVSWLVDLSELNRLNEELAEITAQLEYRNRCLRNENEVKEKKAALEARNALYDRAARSVEKELSQNEQAFLAIGAESEEEFREKLAEIAVRNAYIKRRCNMELLRADTGELSVKELGTALWESCEYLKLCGVSAAALTQGDTMLPADRILAAYGFFEALIEACKPWPKEILVNLSATAEEVWMRMNLTVLGSLPPEDLPGRILPRSGVSASYANEDGVLYYRLLLKKGGDA